MEINLVIPAGGKGSRFSSQEKKQFRQHKGRALLQWTLDAFLPLEDKLNHIVIVLPPGEEEQFQTSTMSQKIHTTQGGSTRQDSVHNGFKKLKELEAGGVWLVHDAARPLLEANSLLALCHKIEETKEGALLALESRDTIKQSDQNGKVLKTLDRKYIWQAQTPQGAPADVLWKASLHAQENDVLTTDEASLLETYSIPVHLIAGSPHNRKITTQEDWEFFTHICP
ncbi:MAG: 2-C-methyl-D-erythritol 4-phosphate cytidylyltransferase [Planctomycetes bacterium]|nr:2-C-methyl-D-erythritol 4-phosphate cytidylyltransferase [Planctomycetota bacterium]